MDDNYQRNFGFCKILWRIENFDLATSKEDWIVCSPEYSVRAKYLTSWKINLKPSMRKEEKGGLINACLTRLENDQGPEVVRANWRMSILTCERTEFIFTENVQYFEKSNCYEEGLLSLNSLLNEVQPFEAGIIYLQCLLIVSFLGVPGVEEDSRFFYLLSKNLSIFYPSKECCEDVLRRHERSLSSLSEDLSVLFASRLSSDIVLKIRDKQISAHKAVLSARNPTFAAILDRNPNIKEVDLFPSKRFDQFVVDFEKNRRPIVNSDAIERIIAYFYSGNLEVVLSNPSITIYESALVFDITEIIDYYQPDEVTLCTSVDVEELVFVWKIFDFDFNDPNHTLSPALNLKETTWRLRLLPNDVDKDNEYISIFAEIIDGMQSLNLSLEFAALNEKGKFIGYKRMRKSITLGGILGFYEFVKKDSSNIENDSISIIFKVRQSCGLETSACEFSSVSFVSPIFTKSDAFSLLSEDLITLFENGKVSDAVILCEDETFAVHKCILFTRTTDEFCKYLHENTLRRNEFLLSDIKPKVLKMFLHFVYSGTIGECEKYIASDIFNIAEKFNMFNLQKICDEILVMKSVFKPRTPESKDCAITAQPGNWPST